MLSQPPRHLSVIIFDTVTSPSTTEPSQPQSTMKRATGLPAGDPLHFCQQHSTTLWVRPRAKQERGEGKEIPLFPLSIQYTHTWLLHWLTASDAALYPLHSLLISYLVFGQAVDLVPVWCSGNAKCYWWAQLNLPSTLLFSYILSLLVAASYPALLLPLGYRVEVI